MPIAAAPRSQVSTSVDVNAYEGSLTPHKIPVTLLDCEGLAGDVAPPALKKRFSISILSKLP